jgi:hypothetical protein
MLQRLMTSSHGMVNRVTSSCSILLEMVLDLLYVFIDSRIFVHLMSPLLCYTKHYGISNTQDFLSGKYTRENKN